MQKYILKNNINENIFNIKAWKYIRQITYKNYV